MFEDLLKELKERDIQLALKDGKISYSGPEENITPELIAQLKENKGKLIKYLWNSNSHTNFMPIQPEGGRIPLFLVHGDVGNYSVSKYLGSDQPVYGFFHLGSEGEEIPYKNVKEMARGYLDTLVGFYSKGPYYLAGFSFGGILAFEMALQLQKEGKAVPFLALIDCYNPLLKKPACADDNLAKKIRGRYLGPLKRAVLQVITDFRNKCYFLMKKPLPSERRKIYIWDKYAALTKKYKPGKYNGSLLLFRSNESKSSYEYLGWDNHADNIELAFVEGKHTEIFWNSNSVQTIATEIKKRLDLLSKSN